MTTDRIRTAARLADVLRRIPATAKVEGRVIYFRLDKDSAVYRYRRETYVEFRGTSRLESARKMLRWLHTQDWCKRLLLTPFYRSLNTPLP